MFNNKTTLILGAGASVPYGYPRGPDLIDRIASGIDKAINEQIPSISIWNHGSADFIGEPYPSLITYIEHFCSGKPSRAELQELARKLSVATHQSIDDFARTNPRLRPILKALVALEIARATYDRLHFKGNSLAINEEFFGRSPINWYSRLISKITDDCHSVQDCYDNNFLSVITFNYDMSLEHYLNKHLGAAEMFSGIDPRQIVTPIHIHGALDFTFEKSGYLGEGLGKQLMECDTRFSIMGEARNNNPDPAKVARAVLFQAERIYVLGFDFHPSNVELLGLSESPTARKIIALNYDGSPRFENRAKAVGIDGENIWRPTNGGTLSIAAALDNGMFDASPN